VQNCTKLGCSYPSLEPNESHDYVRSLTADEGSMFFKKRNKKTYTPNRQDLAASVFHELLYRAIQQPTMAQLCNLHPPKNYG
jgi:hypothetical protein